MSMVMGVLRRRSIGCLLFSTLTPLVLGGCGSGGASAVPSPKPAVETILKDLSTGSYADICHHILGAAKGCKVGTPHSWVVTGYSVGRAVVQGSRALVAITADKVCVLGRCSSNHDAGVGLPRGSFSFDEAWARSTTGQAFFTAALSRVKGVWYSVSLLKRA